MSGSVVAGPTWMCWRRLRRSVQLCVPLIAAVCSAAFVVLIWPAGVDILPHLAQHASLAFVACQRVRTRPQEGSFAARGDVCTPSRGGEGRQRWTLRRAGPSRVIEASAADVEAAVRAGGPVLLDVYAVWCGPCKLMEPALEAIASRLQEYCSSGVCDDGVANPIVLRMDSDAYPSKSTQLRVEGLPTLVLFDGGAEVDRVEGAMSLSDLEEVVEDAFELDGFATAPRPQSSAEVLDSMEVLELAVQTEENLVVGVVAEWMEDSSQIESSLELLPGMLETFPAPRVVIVKAGEMPEAVQYLGLSDFPAVMVFVNGEPVASVMGSQATEQTPGQLAAFVRGALEVL